MVKDNLGHHVGFLGKKCLFLLDVVGERMSSKNITEGPIGGTGSILSELAFCSTYFGYNNLLFTKHTYICSLIRPSHEEPRHSPITAPSCSPRAGLCWEPARLTSEVRHRDKLRSRRQARSVPAAAALLDGPRPWLFGSNRHLVSALEQKVKDTPIAACPAAAPTPSSPTPSVTAAGWFHLRAS